MLPCRVTANHAIIVLDVPDGRLNGLTTLEPPLLPFVHRGAGLAPFDAPAMHPLNTGRVGLHAPVAPIHDCLFDFTARSLDPIIRLADLRGPCVPVIGVANKAFGAPLKRCLCVTARLTLTPNSSRFLALPLLMHSPCGAGNA